MNAEDFFKKPFRCTINGTLCSRARGLSALGFDWISPSPSIATETAAQARTRRYNCLTARGHNPQGGG